MKFASSTDCLTGFRKAYLSIGALTFLALGAPSQARVIRFDVQSTQPFAGGMTFGGSGSFEELVGVATLAVDPCDPLNAGIVDLDAAPKDAHGLVEFSTPFLIIKPTDMSKGNGKIFYGVNNRGTDIEFSAFNFGVPASESSDYGRRCRRWLPRAAGLYLCRCRMGMRCGSQSDN